MGQAQPGDALNISARDWNDMRRLIPRSKGGSNSGGTSQWIPETYYAKTRAGGIPARTGIVLGKATCDLYERNDDDELVSIGRAETVYNISGTAVAELTWIEITQESRRRDFIVVVESCEPAS